MTDLLRPDELEIEERANNATPGPWYHSNDVGHIWSAETAASNPSVAVFEGFTEEKRADDSDFIAAARADVPLLLERLREARQSKWIRVTEQPPELGCEVLTWNGAVMDVYRWLSNTATIYMVTHWCPLPDPPKEGEQ